MKLRVTISEMLLILSLVTGHWGVPNNIKATAAPALNSSDLVADIPHSENRNCTVRTGRTKYRF